MTWPTKKLGEICEEVEKERVPVGTVPYIEIGNIDVNSKKIIFTEKGAVNGSVFAPDNSILISRVRPTRGAVSFLNKKIAVSSAFAIIKPKKDYEPKLIFYFLAWNKKFFDYLGERQEGTNYPSVREEDILGFEITLPSNKGGQQKIVKVLDTIQEAINIQEEIIEKTQELKKSLMGELFKYGGPSFRKGRKLKKTEIGEVPEDWEVVRFGEVFKIVAGGDISKLNLSSVKTEKFVYPIYSNTIDNNGLYGFSDSYQFEGNCITVTARGTIGYAIPRFEKFNAIIRLLVLIPKVNVKIIFVSEFINKKIRVTFENTSIPQLTVPRFSKFYLFLPPLLEQQEIAEILQTIDQKIEIEEKKKVLYEELFKTMLNKIMNQEINVGKIEI